jgi:hypothetical protein
MYLALHQSVCLYPARYMHEERRKMPAELKMTVLRNDLGMRRRAYLSELHLYRAQVCTSCLCNCPHGVVAAGRALVDCSPLDMHWRLRSLCLCSCG